MIKKFTVSKTVFFCLAVDTKVILTDELKTSTSYRTLPLIPVIEEALLRHKEKIEENKRFYGNTK